MACELLNEISITQTENFNISKNEAARRLRVHEYQIFK